MTFFYSKGASPSWTLNVQAVMGRETCRERNWEQGGWWSPSSKDTALQPAWYSSQQKGDHNLEPHHSLSLETAIHHCGWRTSSAVLFSVTGKTHGHSSCYKGEPAFSLSSSSCRQPIVTGDREKQLVAASTEMEITGERWLWVFETNPPLRDTVHWQKGTNHLHPVPIPWLGCGWVLMHNNSDLPSSIREQLLIVLASVSRFSSPMNLDGITLQWLKKVFCNHYWNWKLSNFLWILKPARLKWLPSTSPRSSW